MLSRPAQSHQQEVSLIPTTAEKPREWEKVPWSYQKTSVKLAEGCNVKMSSLKPGQGVIKWQTANLLLGGAGDQPHILGLGKSAAQALSPQRLTWVLKLGKNPDICQATGRQAARRLGSFLNRSSLSNSLRGPEKPRGPEEGGGRAGASHIGFLGARGCA